MEDGGEPQIIWSRLLTVGHTRDVRLKTDQSSLEQLGEQTMRMPETQGSWCSMLVLKCVAVYV